MTHICLQDSELSALLDRPEDDGGRREIESCARCRSRLAAYREFLHPSGVPAGADPDSADAHLAAALEAEIRRPSERAATSSTAARPRGAQGHRNREAGPGGLLYRLWAPALRPIWGVGIVLLAFWGVRSTGLLEPRGSRDVQFREGSQASGRGITLRAAVPEPNGGIRLTWSTAPDADRYQLVIHGRGFVEQMRVEAGEATTITLAHEAFAELSAQGEPVYWRVLAYRNDDLIAESEIEPLDLTPGR